MVDLFKGIPNDTIEIVLQNIEKNLERISLYDGHVIKRHVDIQLGILKTRINLEDIRFATSFYDYQIAKVVILGLLKDCYQNRIRVWLLSVGSDTLVLKKTYNRSLGYGFQKYDDNLHETLNKVCLVLQKEADRAWGFRILTCYPTFDKSDICAKGNI